MSYCRHNDSDVLCSGCTVWSQLAALKAENERLRGALQHIVDAEHGTHAMSLKLLARAALTPPEAKEGETP